MLTYWLIDSFFAFNNMTGCLSREEIFAVYLPFQARSYIASNDCSIFSSYATYYSILRKLFMREMFEFWVYVFSLVFVWFVVGGFFGDGLYFAIIKSMRVVLTALIDREVTSLPRLKSTLFRIPKFNIHAMQFGIRWTIDSPSPLPVAVCPGGHRSVRQFAPVPLVSHRGRYPHDEIISIQRDVYHAALWTVATALSSKFRTNKLSNSGCPVL